MKIKMRTLAAGPNGNLLPDESYEIPLQVSQTTAEELVDGGYAVWIKTVAAVEHFGDGVIENSTLKDTEEAETTDLPISEADVLEKAKPAKKNKSKES